MGIPSSPAASFPSARTGSRISKVTNTSVAWAAESSLINLVRFWFVLVRWLVRSGYNLDVRVSFGRIFLHAFFRFLCLQSERYPLQTFARVFIIRFESECFLVLSCAFCIPAEFTVGPAQGVTIVRTFWL